MGNATGKREAPTIRDVARLAAVAPATVSNVLTGHHAVGAALKARVNDAIAALDYRPNRLAASLRLRRSHTIGIVIPDLTNPFFATLVHHLEDSASAAGYQILLVGSNEEEEREEGRLSALLARHIDGMIMVPARDRSRALTAHRALLPPTVLLDRGFEEAAFDTVAVDNAGACEAACRLLLARGHSDICLLTTTPALANIEARTAGFRSAMRAAGLARQGRVIVGGLDVASCRAAIEAELSRPTRPSAVLAASYVATLGALQAARTLDLDIPADVSLLAFDEADWMSVLHPYLCTIAQPVADLAAEAWRLLEQRMAEPGGKRWHVRIACSLVERESIRALGQSPRRPKPFAVIT